MIVNRFTYPTMNTARPTVAHITTTAIRLLCREIGAAQTARFINQFTLGTGNYTEERDQIIGNPTVEELLSEVGKGRKKSAT
jgi:hypothetical protein